jgi:hypothetical protein
LSTVLLQIYFEVSSRTLVSKDWVFALVDTIEYFWYPNNLENCELTNILELQSHSYYSEHTEPQKILGGLEWISRILQGSLGVYLRADKVPSSFRSGLGDPLNNPERMEH